MSNSKYKKLMEYVPDEWTPQSPIEVVKGAILMDTEKNENKNLLLQLKLCNNSLEKINSVHINILCYDDLMNFISEEQYAYQDLNVNPLDTFGEKVPIWLSNSKIRNVKVNINKVMFLNKKIIDVTTMESIKKPNITQITNLPKELYNELLRIQDDKFGINKNILALPEQIKNDFWICTCGKINLINVNQCRRCGINKKLQFAVINLNYLQESYNQHKVKLEEEQKIKKEKAKKRKSIIIKLTITIIVLIILYVTIVYGIPKFKFILAEKELANKNYIETQNILAEMLDYNGAKDLYTEATYEYGKQLKEVANYEGAMQQFETIKHYKDVDLMISEITVTYAEELMKNKEYEKVISTLQNENSEKSIELIKEARYNYANEKLKLSEYNIALEIYNTISGDFDVTEQIKECTYQIGLLYKKDGKYEEALACFQQNSSYKDSINYIQEIYYNIALEKMEANNFESAMEYFNKTSGYGKSREKIIKCKYNLAKNYISNGNYTKAQQLLNTISYKDSSNLLKECNYQIATSKLKNKDYSNALSEFKKIGDYKESLSNQKECTYQLAIINMKNSKLDEARKAFVNLAGYKESSTYINDIDIAKKWSGRWNVKYYYSYGILNSIYEPYGDIHGWYIEIDYINKSLYTTRGYGNQFSSTGGKAMTYQAIFSDNYVTANNETYILQLDGTLKQVNDSYSYYIYQK